MELSREKLELNQYTHQKQLPKAFCYLCAWIEHNLWETSRWNPTFVFNATAEFQWLPAITTVIAYRQYLFQIKERSLKFSLNAYDCLGVDILGAMIAQVTFYRVEFYKSRSIKRKLQCILQRRFALRMLLSTNIFLGIVLEKFFWLLLHDFKALAVIVPLKIIWRRLFLNTENWWLTISSLLSQLVTV